MAFDPSECKKSFREGGAGLCTACILGPVMVSTFYKVFINPYSLSVQGVNSISTCHCEFVRQQSCHHNYYYAACIIIHTHNTCLPKWIILVLPHNSQFD